MKYKCSQILLCFVVLVLSNPLLAIVNLRTEILESSENRTLEELGISGGSFTTDFVKRTLVLIDDTHGVFNVVKGDAYRNTSYLLGIDAERGMRVVHLINYGPSPIRIWVYKFDGYTEFAIVEKAKTSFFNDNFELKSHGNGYSGENYPNIQPSRHYFLTAKREEVEGVFAPLIKHDAGFEFLVAKYDICGKTLEDYHVEFVASYLASGEDKSLGKEDVVLSPKTDFTVLKLVAKDPTTAPLESYMIFQDGKYLSDSTLVPASMAHYFLSNDPIPELKEGNEFWLPAIQYAGAMAAITKIYKDLGANFYIAKTADHFALINRSSRKIFFLPKTWTAFDLNCDDYEVDEGLQQLTLTKSPQQLSYDSQLNLLENKHYSMPTGMRAFSKSSIFFKNTGFVTPRLDSSEIRYQEYGEGSMIKTPSALRTLVKGTPYYRLYSYQEGTDKHSFMVSTLNSLNMWYFGEMPKSEFRKWLSIPRK